MIFFLSDLFYCLFETFSVFIFISCSFTEHVVLTNQQKQELLERYRYQNSVDSLHYWLQDQLIVQNNNCIVLRIELQRLKNDSKISILFWFSFTVLSQFFKIFWNILVINDFISLIFLSFMHSSYLPIFSVFVSTCILYSNL